MICHPLNLRRCNLSPHWPTATLFCIAAVNQSWTPWKVQESHTSTRRISSLLRGWCGPKLRPTNPHCRIVHLRRLPHHLQSPSSHHVCVSKALISMRVYDDRTTASSWMQVVQAFDVHCSLPPPQDKHIGSDREVLYKGLPPKFGNTVSKQQACPLRECTRAPPKCLRTSPSNLMRGIMGYPWITLCRLLCTQVLAFWTSLYLTKWQIPCPTCYPDQRSASTKTHGRSGRGHCVQGGQPAQCRRIGRSSSRCRDTGPHHTNWKCCILGFADRAISCCIVEICGTKNLSLDSPAQNSNFILFFSLSLSLSAAFPVGVCMSNAGHWKTTYLSKSRASVAASATVSSSGHTLEAPRLVARSAAKCWQLAPMKL